MAFLDFVITLITYVAGFALIIFVFFANIAVGWIPILVIIFSDLQFRFDGNPFEAWACWALIEYLVIAGFFASIWLLLYLGQGDILPRWLRVFAYLFPHPAEDALNRSNGPMGFDGKAFAEGLREKPKSRLWAKMRTYQSRKMKKNVDAHTEYLREQEELAKAAVLKAKAQRASTEWKKEKEKAEDTPPEPEGPEPN